MSEIEYQHFDSECAICRRIVYYNKAIVCEKHKKDIILEFLKKWEEESRYVIDGEVYFHQENHTVKQKIQQLEGEE